MASSSTTGAKLSVTLEVPENHPVLEAYRTLDWESVETCLAGHWRVAGKNVDRGPGRPFDLKYWARVMVLMLLLKLNLRQVEWELKYNAVARLFVRVQEPSDGLVRDHANIDRTYRALGVDGLEELNRLVIGKAQELEFTDGKTLSSDTTTQEVRIPHPNEPGILRQLAQKVGRLCKKVVKKGGEKFKEVAERVAERAKDVLRTVKEYRLFAKGKEEKEELLEEMLEESDEMMRQIVGVQATLAGPQQSGVLQRLGRKLSQLQSFASTLFGQIRIWMETGKVAKGKLLHPELVEARSQPKKKPGKKVEFGFKWLVGRLRGGYLFGEMFFGSPGESQMPLLAIESYQKVLDTQEVPELFVYDRGGWSEDNVSKLRQLEVPKIGIQPKGQAAWCVEESDQDMVATQRALAEASIGTIKTGGYGFNKPRTYSTSTTEMAGHRAIASRNLNQLMKDIQNQAKTNS